MINKMKCLRFIENLDYLSNEVKLPIHKNETRLKTAIGGLLSILSVIAVLSFGLYFFVLLIKRDTIYVTASNESSKYSNLTDTNNYPFLIRLTDKQNKPFSDPTSIYQINLKYWYGGSNDSLEMVGQKTVDIDMEPCDINKHFGKYDYLFKDITDLNTFYCAEARPYNETIYGRYGDIYPFGYYHFYVSMCNNKTSCLPLNEIKTITENVYLDYRTIDCGINSQTTKAKVETVHTDRHMLSSTVYKRIWVYLNEIKYFTDSGLFFTDQSIEYFSQYDSMKYDIDLRDIFVGTIPGTFTTMTIVNTGNALVYNRKYLKLQEYVASVGGIAKFVQIIAFMLNYIYAKNTYHLKLIDQLYGSNHALKTDNHNDKTEVNFSNIKLFPMDPPNNTNHITLQYDPNTPGPKHKKPIGERLYLWYYRLIPLQLYPKTASQVINRLLDKIFWRMNIITLLKTIEDNCFYIKEFMSEPKDLSPFNFKYKPSMRNVNLGQTHYNMKRPYPLQANLFIQDSSNNIPNENQEKK